MCFRVLRVRLVGLFLLSFWLVTKEVIVAFSKWLLVKGWSSGLRAPGCEGSGFRIPALRLVERAPQALNPEAP